MEDEEFEGYYRKLKRQFDNIYYFTGFNNEDAPEKAKVKLKEILEEIWQDGYATCKMDVAIGEEP